MLADPDERSFVSHSTMSIDDDPEGSPRTPIELLEAMSGLQTADALLRWRMRDRLQLKANEIVAIEYLARLLNIGQPVRALDLARALGVTNSATSVIVASLMKRGFLTRSDNPRDGRGHLLHLTPEAMTAIADSLGDSRAELRELLAGLSSRESKRVVVLLHAITDSLNHGGLVPAA
ncbi:MAG: MarR family transcriptional regulator [Herbiconiux sp.]|nr:MAG: MarR family transcriptional regulator [Herbiconiux sp.]